MKRLTWLLLACSLFLVFSPDAQACRAYYSTDTQRGFVMDVNDFAWIFDSAGDFYGCSGAARAKLDAKLANMPVSAWQEWLSGGSVSFVMASGLFINFFDGPMPASLDVKIRDVAANYRFAYPRGDDGQVHCGFDGTRWRNGDTCLEDFAMAASANAWIAAYMRHTGREWRSYRNNAISYLQSMLDANTTCIRKFDSNAPRDAANRGPCNGTYQDLINNPPTGEIVSINHYQQSVAYGLGQMTSFGSALAGLKVAESPFNKNELSLAQQNMIGFLFAEGSSRANADGSFSSNGCFSLNVDAMRLDPGYPCWDTTFTHNSQIGPTPYRADMFKMKPVYDYYGLSTGGATGYMFDKFQDVFFTIPTSPDGEDWNIGRRHFYLTMGSWFPTTSPAMQGRPEYAGGIKRGTYFTVSPNNTSVTLGSGPRSLGTTQNVVIYDLNGASLRHNDKVTIKNVGGLYWTATNGGGSTVIANSSTGGTNQTFTIVKLTETTQMIAHGDQFALKAANGQYLSAPSLGGNVTATAATIGTYEKFTLDRTRFD